MTLNRAEIMGFRARKIDQIRNKREKLKNEATRESASIKDDIIAEIEYKLQEFEEELSEENKTDDFEEWKKVNQSYLDLEDKKSYILDHDVKEDKTWEIFRDEKFEFDEVLMKDVMNRISIQLKSVKNNLKIVSELREEIDDVKDGMCDEDFEEEVKEKLKKVLEKKDKKIETKVKRIEEVKETAVKNKVIVEHHHSLFKQNKTDRYEMKREYYYYKKLCNKVPEWLDKKLDKLPCNRGHIWRGMWLMGKKPEERGKPTCMFEQGVKGVQIIHEYSDTWYTVYEKKGRDFKKMVSRTRMVVRK